MSYGSTTINPPSPDTTLDAMNADRIATARLVSQAHRSNWLRVWRNKTFTPQQMWEAIGAGGKLALEDADAAFGFVNRVLSSADDDYVTLGVPDGSAQYLDLGITSTFAYAVDPATNIVTLTETPATPSDEGDQAEESSGS